MRDDRNRQAEALDDLDQLPEDQQDCAPGMLLMTTTCAAYPTSAGLVYCCNPVLIDAADTEGALPSFTADTSVLIFALNVGSKIPPAGTRVIASGVGGRMVFAYSSGP